MAKKLSEGRKPGSGRKPGKAKTLAEGRKIGSGRKKGSVSKKKLEAMKLASEAIPQPDPTSQTTTTRLSEETEKSAVSPKINLNSLVDTESNQQLKQVMNSQEAYFISGSASPVSDIRTGTQSNTDAIQHSATILKGFKSQERLAVPYREATGVPPLISILKSIVNRGN